MKLTTLKEVNLAKEVDGKTYLTSKEVKAHKELGWSRDSLYRLHRAGLIKPKHFFGDKYSYWDLAELMAVKNTPFDVGELSPKNQPAIAELARVG
jgi:hypothetical protein